MMFPTVREHKGDMRLMPMEPGAANPSQSTAGSPAEMRVTALCCLALFCQIASAQTLLPASDGQVRLVGSDLAVLTSQDERKEIPCNITAEKPALGFDLRYHAAYSVTIPLKELAGAENSLTIIFRVTPANHESEGTYFVQHYSVPEIAEDAGGDAQLAGTIDLGEGNYHIDWMMRDRSQRVCAHFWDSEAALSNKDREMKLELPYGSISAAEPEQFAQEPPVTRALDKSPLKIKVLVNFAPQNFSASALRPEDTTALVSILRRLSREPQFSKFSVVAFNIQEQRVLYRQNFESGIDFPSLGEALKAMKPGTVDAQKLQNKHGDTEFLTDLIQREMSGEDHPDALIFAGPKVMLDASVPEEALKPLASVDYPVFYMNYALNPQAIPWKDSISRAIKVFRGTEYTISRPRDMWFSVSEMISRIVKLSYGRSQIKSAL